MFLYFLTWETGVFPSVLAMQQMRWCLKIKFSIKNYYLGSRFKDSEIERALKKNGFKYLKSKNFIKL